MRETGNPDQWKDGFPPAELVTHDIEAGNSYVCVCDDDGGGSSGGKIAAVFYYNIEDELAYHIINGHWLNNEPYGVVHRIASSRIFRGAGAFA
jgi:hypothetical protein